jgi:hypothetical protein
MQVKRYILFSLYILLLLFSAHPEEQLTIDFYGIKSDTADAGIIEMTQNLYFSQLKVIDDITVSDFRNKTLPEQPSSGHILFFAEIRETDKKDGSWLCTQYVHTVDKTKDLVISKEYSSYYKILTEAKQSLDNLVAKIRAGTAAKKNAANDDEQAASPQAQQTVSTQSIAGTWLGEKNIDKIIILRGGRGFVIYKNGASMNITVRIADDGIVHIKQAGNSNASFFPELPRKTALENAKNAAPIEWLFTLVDAVTLSGQKKTLVSAPDTKTGVTEGTVPVTWQKL